MREPSIAQGMRPNRHPLDEDSAARLLQGLVHPDDAPPGYAAVAGVLNSAARTPLGPVDEDAAATTVSAMVEVIRDAPARTPQIARRRDMLGKLLAGKATLAAVAVLGLTATGAAAATGSLPDSAQSVVSDAVSHVGIDIPHPNHGKSADVRQDGEHKDSGDDQNPSAETPPAENHGQQTSDTVHTAKEGVDKAAGEKVGPAVCAAVGSQCAEHGTSSGSDDQGTPPSTSGSDDDQHGKSAEEHPGADDNATTPTTGSVATGAEHSGRELPSGKGKPSSN